jgi:PAS domain S-box-containing protein
MADKEKDTCANNLQLNQMSHSQQNSGRDGAKSAAAGTESVGTDAQPSAKELALQRELDQVKLERDQARDGLRELQALYSSLVDQLPAGVFRKDSLGRYVFVNPWFCRLKKMRADEMLHKLPEELAKYVTKLNGAEPERCRRESQLGAQGTSHHDLIMRTGKIIEVDEEYPGDDGKPFYAHVVKTPVFDSDGRIAGSQGVLFDVTPSKRAQAELEQERHLLRALLESCPDSIYFKDRESRFMRCSEHLAKLFKAANAGEMVGKSDFDFFTEEHARPAYNDEQAIIRTGETLIKTEKETWPDGRVTWVLTSKMPLRNSAGEVVGTLGISKDVTSTKEAEAKLEAVHRQLVDASRQAGMAEVATSVLHNVGNVLNSVNVSVALLRQGLERSRIDFVAKVAGLLAEHSPDLAEFLNNDAKGKSLPGYLLDLGEALRQEKTTFQAELESLGVNLEHIKVIVSMQQSLAKPGGLVEELEPKEMMEGALQINGASLERHGVQVAREFNAVPKVQADRTKVVQILVNLVKNAKKALEPNERDQRALRVGIRAGASSVQMTVTDNGVGIPPENLTRIFGHGFTTRKDGHGFGLHSSALAAKEMGGSLSVLSEGPGKGATFTLELPVKAKTS